MDKCTGLIVCKNRIKYRTDVAIISAENRKDVRCLGWKMSRGFLIDVSL